MIISILLFGLLLSRTFNDITIDSEKTAAGYLKIAHRDVGGAVACLSGCALVASGMKLAAANSMLLAYILLVVAVMILSVAAGKPYGWVALVLATLGLLAAVVPGHGWH